MEALLLYIIKSSVYLSLLYLGYMCLLRNTTHFCFNRSVLLWGSLVCLFLPFIQIQLKEAAPLQMPIEAIRSVITTQTSVATQEGQIDNAPTWDASSLVVMAGIGYFIGCLIVFIIALFAHLSVRTIIHRAVCYQYGSYKLYVSQGLEESFSWGQSIVVPKALYDSKEDLNEILLHEISHLRHRHTIDLVVMQLLTIFHWFNPFVWLLRNQLIDIHEYQADHDVINQGINATKYQHLLVKKAVGGRLYILANGFNRSKLKKRITMMLKKRTNRMVQLRALLFVPLVAGAIYSFATTVPVNNTGQDSQWVYPIPGSTLAGKYGGEHQRKHAGIDLKADKGTKIQSASNGVVVSATSDRNYGNKVVVRHDNGLETVYAHNSENLVKEGDKVKAGQVIALVGNTGRITNPCCHFEIRKEGAPIDPEVIFDTTAQTPRTK